MDPVEISRADIERNIGHEKCVLLRNLERGREENAEKWECFYKQQWWRKPCPVCVGPTNQIFGRMRE